MTPVLLMMVGENKMTRTELVCDEPLHSMIRLERGVVVVLVMLG